MVGRKASSRGQGVWLKKVVGRWQLFKKIEPGHRFRTRYHSHRQRRQQGETSQYGWMVNLISAGPRS
jgi:hypothetical protein